MTDRQKAIAKAKEAYHFFLTHVMHTPGFNHFGKGYVFVTDKWVVYMNANGAVYSTIETKDMP